MALVHKCDVCDAEIPREGEQPFQVTVGMLGPFPTVDHHDMRHYHVCSRDCMMRIVQPGWVPPRVDLTMGAEPPPA